MPTKQRNLFFVLTLALCLGLAVPAFAVESASPVESVKVDNLPALQIKHWKASTTDDKNAFLFGFATMLDLEKEWQGAKPVAIKQSLTGCWVKGLAGVSVKQMRDAVDSYGAAHPEDADRQVVEVLWLHFVQPKLSPQERKDVAAAYKAAQARK